MLLSAVKLPYVQAIACKHDFGTGRYVTLMVSKFPKGAKGSLFGTELQSQIDFPCGSIEHGRLIADAKFRQLFSSHSCNESCMMNWHPFPLNDATATTQ